MADIQTFLWSEILSDLHGNQASLPITFSSELIGSQSFIILRKWHLETNIVGAGRSEFSIICVSIRENVDMCST